MRWNYQKVKQELSKQPNEKRSKQIIFRIYVFHRFLIEYSIHLVFKELSCFTFILQTLHQDMRDDDPLLGFTWLFGLLSSEDKICAYIHTVLSSTRVNTTISIFHQVGVEKCYPSKGKAQKNVFKISTAITAHVYKFCFTGIPDVSFSLCAKHSGNWQFGRQWIYHSHNNY